jgi:hypothetical protein
VPIDASPGTTDVSPASAEPTPLDPLSVVKAWEAARNAGDIEQVLALTSNVASIFGISMSNDADRARYRSILAAQRIAGHTVEDTDCDVAADRVTCRYLQQDAFLRRCGLQLTGEHRFRTLDGLVVSARRDHDQASQDAVYDAIAAFRDWVRDVDPPAAVVIWSDDRNAFYSTPEGARAMLGLLDRYVCPPAASPV